jgi:YidC/Oxa1 family membrane protein insertase
MLSIYNELLYRPLFNLLIFLYNTISFENMGVAIILLTLLIRVVFLPLSQKAIKSQKALQELQPKIKAIQAQYKDNKEEQAKQLMAFYKTNKINPLSGCLPLIIQLPILIALYQVFLKGLKPESLSALYMFVQNPGLINTMFFSWFDLAQASKILALAAGILQFWQAKMITPSQKLPSVPKASDEFLAQAISKQTLYFLPLLTIMVSWRLPAGLTIYWVFTTLFTILQQYVIIRRTAK